MSRVLPERGFDGPLGAEPSTSNGSTSRDAVRALRGRLNATLLGKPQVVEDVLTSLLAGAHLLLEDVPGLGKTTLAKAVAAGVGGTFGRVQCTPDLLPADVTGFNVFDQRTREFEFLPGPVFADVLLVDEINRATPRTQSALLEAMAERQVTVDNVRRPLGDAFFVMATQNPIEHGGTYPLPEAQLDRFGMRLSVGYPDPTHERAMLAAAVRPPGDDRSIGPVFGVDPAEDEPPLTPAGLVRLREKVAAVVVGEAVNGYLVTLAAGTRTHPHVTLGCSPRGLLTWQRLSQARAVLGNRHFVTPDDVQAVARPVLSVRLGGEPAAVSEAIDSVLLRTPVPTR